MAVDPKLKQQVFQALQGEGLRFLLKPYQSPPVQNIKLAKGEPIWLADKEEIRLGNGSQVVSELAGKKYSPTTALPPTATPDEIADNFWDKMKTKALWSISSTLAPLPIISKIISRKPSNFSFMLGEAFNADSIASNFFEKAISAHGLPFRNINHGDLTNDPDGTGLKSGDFQSFAITDHSHDLGIFEGSASGQDNTDGLKAVIEKVKVTAPEEGNLPTKQSNLCLPPKNSGAETRMASLRVLMIWRVG